MNEIALTIAGESELALPDERLELLRHTYGQGCSPAEFDLFVAAARRLGLDPFARQITLTPRRKKVDGRWVEVFEPVVTIDGFRAVAERSGEYEGQTAAQWCGQSANWHDVWISPEPPIACRVGVYRRGWREPIWGIAMWDAYAAKKHDGSLIGWWAKGGAHMLAKCAEALALRRAFPNTLGGVYSPEEMQQADGPAKRARPKPQAAPAPAVAVEAEIVESAPETRQAAAQATQSTAGDGKTRQAFEDVWRRLAGVVGRDKARAIWDALELPPPDAPPATMAPRFPTLRELGEMLPAWVAIGSAIKVLKNRGADSPALPALETSKPKDLAGLASRLAEDLGELTASEVRLLARKVTEDAITREITARFPYGTPVSPEDIRRTWLESAPLGGRLDGPQGDADGTIVYQIKVHRS